jgi:hypothetical protein
VVAAWVTGSLIVMMMKQERKESFKFKSSNREGRSHVDKANLQNCIIISCFLEMRSCMSQDNIDNKGVTYALTTSNLEDGDSHANSKV